MGSFYVLTISLVRTSAEKNIHSTKKCGHKDFAFTLVHPRRATTATRHALFQSPTTAGGAPRVCALSLCAVAQFVFSFVFEGLRPINCPFVLRILIHVHVGRSASPPPSGPYAHAADGSTAISIATDGPFSVFDIDLDCDGR